jgi:negative regulator of replication initiation
MPKIEISAELQTLLAKTAEERGCTPGEVLATMLASSSEALQSHPLVAYTQSPEFRAKYTDADRYVALLSWVARNHPTDFSDFIEHQDSGRRYLGLSPEEIRETCRHNQAREVPDTHYWAIMNLDTPTKRRFLRRLLVFVGTRDEVINHVLATIGQRTTG